MNRTFCQVNLQNGLIAYYPFNGNANDESGNNLHGKRMNGIALTQDKYGKANSAFYFNGIDNYIEIADNELFSFKDSFTVALQFCNDKNFLGGELIEKRDFYTGANSSFDISAGSLGAIAAIKTDGDCNDAGNGWNYSSKSTTLVANQWYCLVLTFYKGKMDFFIDGNLISSTKTKGVKINDCRRGKLRIGHHLAFGKNPYKGKMDEIRLYTRRLNKPEIQALCYYNKENTKNCMGADFVKTNFSIEKKSCLTYKYQIDEIVNDYSYLWQFGDGKTSSKKMPFYTYSKAGNYTVQLIVTNKIGCKDTVTKKITIAKVETDFTYTSGEQSSLLTFNANDKKLQHSWYFGDNATKEEGTTITHAFQQQGDYAVTLTSTDQFGCVNSKSKTITISTAPLTSNMEIVLPAYKNQILADANLQLVQKINQRAKNVIQTIPVVNDSITVYFYDNAEVDGDSITVSFNNSVIEKNLLLSAKGKKYQLHLDKTIPINELVMYAENQGNIPPNTALMLIYDGEKRYELHITSTDTTNGTVVFTFNKK